MLSEVVYKFMTMIVKSPFQSDGPKIRNALFKLNPFKILKSSLSVMSKAVYVKNASCSIFTRKF